MNNPRKFLDHVYKFCDNPNPRSFGVGDIPCFVLALGNPCLVTLGPGSPPVELPSSMIHDSPVSMGTWKNPNGKSFAEEMSDRQKDSNECMTKKPDAECFDGTETVFWSHAFGGKKYVAWQVQRESSHLVFEEIDEKDDVMPPTNKWADLHRIFIAKQKRLEEDSHACYMKVLAPFRMQLVAFAEDLFGPLRSEKHPDAKYEVKIVADEDGGISVRLLSHFKDEDDQEHSDILVAVTYSFVDDAFIVQVSPQYPDHHKQIKTTIIDVGMDLIAHSPLYHH